MTASGAGSALPITKAVEVLKEEPQSEPRSPKRHRVRFSMNASEMPENGFGELSEERGKYLLSFSAHSERTLERNIKKVLNRASDFAITDLAYSLSAAPGDFPWRSYVLASAEDLATTSVEEELRFGRVFKEQPTLAFAFTGQGAQWPQMGFALVQQYPSVRQTFIELDNVLAALPEPPAWTLLGSISAPKAISKIHEASLAQPLCTALQIAMTRLLWSWEIRPDAVVGHSSGEIAAAYTAGFITAEQAIIIAYQRGLSAMKCRLPGAMLGVGVGTAKVGEHIANIPHLVIACENSPESVTLSGSVDAIEEAENILTKAGIYHHRLNTGGVGYHSWLMTAAGEDYEANLRNLLLPDDPVADESSHITMISSVTAAPVSRSDITVEYWRTHMGCPVLFNHAVGELLKQEDPINHIIEIGPHSSLSGFLREIKKAAGWTQEQLSYVPTLKRDSENVTDILEMVGKLFLAGYPVDLGRVNARESIELDSNGQYQVWQTPGDLVELPMNQRKSAESTPRSGSPIMNDHGVREHHHSLLGSKIPGTSKAAPTWRNLLTLQDVSWLRDQKVGDDIAFPAAGYAALAIEAASQAASGKLKPQSFTITNMKIKAAMILRDDTTTELVFDLRASEASASSWDFVASTVTDGKWFEHATGAITVDHEAHRITPILPEYPTVRGGINKESNDRRWYSSMENVGLAYGPAFRSLSNIRTAPEHLQATASVTACESSNIHDSHYVIHPTVISGCLQLAIIAAHDGDPKSLLKPFLPTAINRLAIQPPSNASTMLSARGHGANNGLRSLRSTVEMKDNRGSVVFQADVDYRSFDNNFSAEEPKPLQPYTRLVWKPDVDRLSSAQLQTLFETEKQADASRSLFDALEEASTLAILSTIEGLPQNIDLDALEEHIYLFLKWLKRQESDLNIQKYKELNRSQKIERLNEIVKQVGSAVPELAMVAKLASRMPEIIDGSASAMDVMAEEQQNASSSEEAFSQMGAYAILQKTLDLITHKEPALRVLEVGGGSGGVTKRLLSVLNGNSSATKYLEYTFTDASSTYIHAAQKKLDGYANMKFELLDIEINPLEQGFEENSFDILFAPNVLHGTEDVETSLAHCKKLLKPEGRLILIETTKDRLIDGFMLGTLPGYWLGGEDGRGSSPFMSKDAWNQKLIDVGLSGTDIALDDYPEPNGCTTLMISHKLPEVKTPSSDVSTDESPVWLVYRDEPHAMLPAVEKIYKSRGLETRRVTLAEFPTQAQRGARAVLFAELEGPLLASFTEAEMEAIKEFVRLARTCVWLTNGGLLTGRNPDKSLVFGFAKSIMIEQPSFNVTCIDIDPETPTPAVSAPLVVDVEIEFRRSPTHDSENELVEKNGVLYVSRYVSDEAENDDYMRLQRVKPERRPMADNMVMEFEKIGHLNSFYYKEKPAQKELLDTEVLVQASAFVLDKPFLSIMKGVKNHSYFSLECGGTILSVGPRVLHLRPGDRVVCLKPTKFDTTFAIHQDLCFRLSESERFDDMVSQLLPFSEAFHVLHTLCRLEKGDSILIDCPGDAQNLAMVDVALDLGATVFATYSDERERLWLESIGSISLIDSRERYVPNVASATDTGSFSVIVTNGLGLAPEYIIDQIQTSGRIALFSDRVPAAFSASTSALFAKGVSIGSFDPIRGVETGQVNISRTLPMALRFIRSHDTHISSISLGIDRLGEAIVLSDSLDIHDRLVLTCGNEVVVPTQLLPSQLTFTADSTYFLVGCLGGLGRSLTTWMIARGARNFIFLSRSGADKPEAAALVEELDEIRKYRYHDLSIQVVRGDVSKREDVKRAVGHARTPIKGVIQAAVVYKDLPFGATTASQFSQMIAPKVRGTWNLHDTLAEHDLDFFVMTSSCLGAIGAATQSNYSAANAFLDNMARHRHSQGLQATSIALGMIVDVGHVEEHPEVEKALKRNGMYGISVDEYLLSMELAMRRRDLTAPSSAYDRYAASTVFTGMDPSRISRVGGKSMWLKDSRLRHMAHAMGPESATSLTGQDSPRNNTAALLAALKGGPDAIKLKIQELLMNRFSKLVLLPVKRMDPAKPLAFYGMDSMISAEIRSWAWKEVKADVPFLTLLDQSLTFVALAELMYGNMDTSFKRKA